MIGLKRGTVQLQNHQKEWEENAAETINTLRDILGDAAYDIQHIGSTSIRHIKAKPIIDIAVSVNDFENDTRTHHIHVVRVNSKEWTDYINFRNYLNTFPEKAKEYEAVKTELRNRFPNDREAYTEGKSEFIKYTLRKALVLSYLGKTVNVDIDRPKGSVHSKHKGIIYPVNYGYISNVIGTDEEELDVYVMGVNKPVRNFCGKVIGIIHREDDIEDKLVVASENGKYTEAQIKEATNFQEQYFHTHIELAE